MSKVSVGHKGSVAVLSTVAGPKRPAVRLVQFISDTGSFTITNSAIKAEHHVVAVINVTTGALLYSPGEWKDGAAQNTIDHADTGSTTNTAANQVCFAIMTDTGPQ